RGLHTMPMKKVIVGSGAQDVEEHDDEEGHQSEDHHGQSEGFSMHFTEPENVKSASEIGLVVHLQVDGKPLEQARVRYEIWDEANPDKHDWIDATESEAGEYASDYTFAQAGAFSVQIHVEDDKDL